LVRRKLWKPGRIDLPGGRKWIFVAASIAIASAAVALALHFVACGDPQDGTSQLLPLPPSREFVDRRGDPLFILLADNQSYRQPVELDAVSVHFLNAIIAVEDRRFWRHAGVDYRAILRAAGTAAMRGEFVSGASTITQQLAKLHLSAGAPQASRTFARKWKEIRLARWMETHWSKEKILSDYVNRLEFGHQQQGIRAASWFYFGKPPGQLGIAESALLAALPNAPSRLSPLRHPGRARARQLHVLDRMLATGAISAEEHQRAIREPLRLRKQVAARQAPVFVDLLLRRRGVSGLHAADDGRLMTTLDAELTSFATRVLEEQLATLRDKRVGQGAVVILHNPTAEVLALATSGRGADGSPGTINGAWEPRSAGSALKPFAFLLALEQGAFPGTIVADVPVSFATPTGVYRPNNFNGRFHGPVSLRHALGNSLNIAAIQTLQKIGGPDVLHRFLRELGFSTLDNLPPHYGLGLVLGNAETRLLELANAYATVARMGVYLPLRFLRDGPSAATGGRVLFSPESASLLADMLTDNAARSATFGLDSDLRFPFPVAVKTGTSSNYRDNVVVGFTPEFTVAVWVGNGDGSPMRQITGVTGAAPVLQTVFQHLHRSRGTGWFARPGGIKQYTVHALTGKLMERADALPLQLPELRREFAASVPPAANARDFDEKGRTILGPEYAQWWSFGESALGGRAVLDEGSGSARILYPPPGTRIYLDPELPADFQRLQARCTGAATFRWSSPSLPDPADGGFFLLHPGRHEIRAHNETTGEILDTWITVEEL
jgi:penicillin-binding protein 1C